MRTSDVVRAGVGQRRPARISPAPGARTQKAAPSLPSHLTSARRVEPDRRRRPYDVHTHLDAVSVRVRRRPRHGSPRGSPAALALLARWPARRAGRRSARAARLASVRRRLRRARCSAGRAAARRRGSARRTASRWPGPCSSAASRRWSRTRSPARSRCAAAGRAGRGRAGARRRRRPGGPAHRHGVGARRALRHGGRRVPDPGAQRVRRADGSAPWVLADRAGALRCCVAAGWLLPWLRRPVPPRYWPRSSRRSRAIVLTVVAGRRCCRGRSPPLAVARAGRCWPSRSARASGGCGAPRGRVHAAAAAPVELGDRGRSRPRPPAVEPRGIRRRRRGLTAVASALRLVRPGRAGPARPADPGRVRAHPARGAPGSRVAARAPAAAAAPGHWRSSVGLRAGRC